MKNGNSIDLIGKIKECSKSWLLPYPFKIVGQAMLMAVLIGLVATIFNLKGLVCLHRTVQLQLLSQTKIKEHYNYKP